MSTDCYSRAPMCDWCFALNSELFSPLSWLFTQYHSCNLSGMSGCVQALEARGWLVPPTCFFWAKINLTSDPLCLTMSVSSTSKCDCRHGVVYVSLSCVVILLFCTPAKRQSRGVLFLFLSVWVCVCMCVCLQSN